MKYNWLNRENNSKIIVFFNGWGMDDYVIKHLKSENFDILSFCDYESFEDINIDFSIYSEKILICWSMGVYIANLYYEKFKNFDRFIAVNGTQKPIDDKWGIPIAIYDLMIDNFNETTVSRFMKKMTLSDELVSYKSRSDEELKNELISIKKLNPDKYLKFDKAIISKKDKIIPAKNQLAFWQEQGVKIKEKDLPHYIFNTCSFWSDLL